MFQARTNNPSSFTAKSITPQIYTTSHSEASGQKFIIETFAQMYQASYQVKKKPSLI